jgi:hypothetical protein
LCLTYRKDEKESIETSGNFREIVASGEAADGLLKIGRRNAEVSGKFMGIPSQSSSHRCERLLSLKARQSTTHNSYFGEGAHGVGDTVAGGGLRTESFNGRHGEIDPMNERSWLWVEEGIMRR